MPYPEHIQTRFIRERGTVGKCFTASDGDIASVRVSTGEEHTQLIHSKYNPRKREINMFSRINSFAISAFPVNFLPLPKGGGFLV